MQTPQDAPETRAELPVHATIHWPVITTLGLAFLTTGCGSPTDTLTSLSEAVSADVSAVALASPEGDDITSDAELSFQPRHPERVDPFTFPTADEASGGDSGTLVTKATQVELMGFADVGRPQVVLRIEGVTKLLSVGDRFEGIEVIAISSPTVDLRSGSLQWRASLFNNASRGQ